MSDGIEEENGERKQAFRVIAKYDFEGGLLTERLCLQLKSSCFDTKLDGLNT